MTSKFLFLISYFYVIQLTVQTNTINSNTIDFLIKQVFPLNNNEVSKYEFVKLATPYSHRYKRYIRPVEFEFDKETVKLFLSPLEKNVMIRDLPIWTVETATNTASGHIYTKQNKSTIFYDGWFLEDINNKAIVYATYRDGQMYYDGVYGEGRKRKIIRSLPERFLHSELAGLNDHIIIEASEKSTTDIKEFNHTLDWSYYKKLAKPLDILYPKLLVVIEAEYFKTFNENIHEAVQYMSIYWNVVGLKYREIAYPQVNLMITGIVIAKDDTALNFIYKARDENNPKILNISRDFNVDGNNYFEFTFGDEVMYKNYDSAVLMTNLTVPGVAGQAFHATICNKYLIYLFDESVYDSTMAAAHELGHSLGMTHDNMTESHSYYNSTILNPISRNTEKYFWSQRSLTELKEFSKIEKASCLENKYRIK